MRAIREVYKPLQPANAEYSLISLTQGFAALVDREDFERFSAFKWHAHRAKNGIVYAYRPGNIALHRLILNAPPESFVDHRNRNGLDCRRANLRLATMAENNRNIKRRSNLSGFHGVMCCNSGGGYRGAVSVDGKKIYTPKFSTALDAALKRDLLAIRHHGEFAVLNFQFLSIEVRQ